MCTSLCVLYAAKEQCTKCKILCINILMGVIPCQKQEVGNVIKHIQGLSNGAMCQKIKPFKYRSYTDCTFGQWLSGVRSSRSVVSDPLQFMKLFEILLVGRSQFSCYIAILRDFLDSSLCIAATMATLLSGILRSVDSLCLLLSVGVTLDVPRSFLVSPNIVAFWMIRSE